jgi:hypothetical protein
MYVNDKKADSRSNSLCDQRAELHATFACNTAGSQRPLSDAAAGCDNVMATSGICVVRRSTQNPRWARPSQLSRPRNRQRNVIVGKKSALMAVAHFGMVC